MATTATQAVFNTYELLEKVIFMLPPRKITQVMRVSKSWNQMISDSSRIYDKRILNTKYDPTYISRLNILDFDDVGMYHPVTGLASEAYAWVGDFAGKRRAVVEYSFPIPRTSECHSKGSFDAFLTRLPVQVVEIRFELKRDGRNVTSSVYNRNGVRMRDLLEITAAMLKDQGQDEDQGEGEVQGEHEFDSVCLLKAWIIVDFCDAEVP